MQARAAVAKAMCVHAGSGSGCVASILSPCSALPDLCSPLSTALPFLSSLGTTPASLAGLLCQPGAQAPQARSTSTQHFSGGCCSSQQQQAASALKGGAAAAAAGAAAAAAAAVAAAASVPVVPSSAVPAMVPVGGCSAVVPPMMQLGLGLELLPILPLELCQQQQQLDMPVGRTLVGIPAGSLSSEATMGAAAAETDLGRGGGGGVGIPEIVFKLLPPQQGGPLQASAACEGGRCQPGAIAMDGGCWPLLADRATLPLEAAVTTTALGGEVHAAAANGGTNISLAAHQAPAGGCPPQDAGGGAAVAATALGAGSNGKNHEEGTLLAAACSGGGGGATAIVEKIREVEGKVWAVEKKCGPLSLKTGKAYFLLHHACLHPQAVPLFQAKADEALQR